MKFRYLSLLFTWSILLGACGGGGASGDSATATNLPFELFPSGYFTAGYLESYVIAGSSSAGAVYEGTVSYQTQATSTFDSKSAVPVLAQLSVTNTQTAATLTVNSTAYMSTTPTARTLLGEYYSLSDVTTIASSTSAIPTTATIGAVGVVGNYNSSDGGSTEVSWRLENGKNGLAKFVLAWTSQDVSGNLESTQEQSFTIDQDGIRRAIAINAYDVASNVTIQLSGTIQ